MTLSLVEGRMQFIPKDFLKLVENCAANVLQQNVVA
jgi:hypothetical protein